MIKDWRLGREQEDYLMEATLIHTPYLLETHYHCDFCWDKFMKNQELISDCNTVGYVTENGNVWICEKCFNDFKSHFKWNVVEAI